MGHSDGFVQDQNSAPSYFRCGSQSAIRAPPSRGRAATTPSWLALAQRRIAHLGGARTPAAPPPRSLIATPIASRGATHPLRRGRIASNHQRTSSTSPPAAPRAPLRVSGRAPANRVKDHQQNSSGSASRRTRAAADSPPTSSAARRLPPPPPPPPPPAAAPPPAKKACGATQGRTPPPPPRAARRRRDQRHSVRRARPRAPAAEDAVAAAMRRRNPAAETEEPCSGDRSRTR